MGRVVLVPQLTELTQTGLIAVTQPAASALPVPVCDKTGAAGRWSRHPWPSYVGVRILVLINNDILIVNYDIKQKQFTKSTPEFPR